MPLECPQGRQVAGSRLARMDLGSAVDSVRWQEKGVRERSL